MSNFDYYPGRAQIAEVKISKLNHQLDITPMVLEVSQNTSIYDSTISIDFVLSDSKSLLSKLPIENGDVITYKLVFADKTESYKVRVSNIRDISNLETKFVYTIECISDFEFNSLSKFVSKSYKGLTSEIAKSVLEDTDPNVKIGYWEDSVINTHFISPYWSPKKIMNYLSNKSKPTTDDVLFWFFQDRNHRYNFVPIENLSNIFKENPVEHYVYGADTSSKNGLPNTEMVNRTILELSIENLSNAKQRFGNNVFGGSLEYFDVNQKILHRKTYDYWRDYKDNRLNKEKLVNETFEFNKGSIKSMNILSDTNDVREFNENLDISKIKRSNFNLSDTLFVTVRGNRILDLGKTIIVDVPSIEPKNDSQKSPKDERLSGRYVIVGQRDIFQKGEHITALSLKKDSSIKGDK